METINLREEFIKLGQALKAAGFVESGVEAKEVIQEGLVLVNGEIDTRRGRKLYKGDIVSFENQTIKIDGDNYTFDNTKRYMLMNDIDLSGENWTPIDTESAMIDGNNHSIKNLTISTDLSDIKRPGLFCRFSLGLQLSFCSFYVPLTARVSLSKTVCMYPRRTKSYSNFWNCKRV